MKKLLSILTLGFVAFSSNIYAWNLCSGDKIHIIRKNATQEFLDSNAYRGLTSTTAPGVWSSQGYIPPIEPGYHCPWRVIKVGGKTGDQIHFRDEVYLQNTKTSQYLCLSSADGISTSNAIPSDEWRCKFIFILYPNDGCIDGIGVNTGDTITGDATNCICLAMINHGSVGLSNSTPWRLTFNNAFEPWYLKKAN